MDHADEQHVVWSARVHAGEFAGGGEVLPLLSSMSGEANLPDFRELLSSSPPACYLAAMALDLSEASRANYPLEPVATPSPLMTVFVEGIVNRWTNDRELVARVDIVLDDCSAFASITTQNEPRTDVPPVACDRMDGVWDIVLKVLRAIFPMVHGR